MTTTDLAFQIHSEINKMEQTYKTEIMRMEFQINTMIYKSKEINKLINDDNVDKLTRVNAVDITNPIEVQRVLEETPSIKLFNEYLDELSTDMVVVRQEMERKRSFYERIKRHIYSTCDHLWIDDHFENPASMSMVGCTYCNVCGMTRDDI
jgi:hypothetical protein